MSFSLVNRRRQIKKKRQLFFISFFTIILLIAAIYIYGSRIRVSILMSKGHTYLTQGNLELALAEFNKILEIYANHPQAIDAIGLIYLSQGDISLAEIKYEQALKHGLKLNKRFDHIKVGNDYLNKGIYLPAELSFRHAIDLNPKNAQAYLGRALALHALGKMTTAIELYRKSLTLKPDLTVAQNMLKRAQEELNRGFIYYIHDRNKKPLASFSIKKKNKKRLYSLAQYASHIIGFSSQKHGNAGLEKTLETYLPGNTLTLSIDSSWQYAADQAMGWRKGCLVAIQPKTGEILALINHPFFNPNKIDKDWRKIKRNKNKPLENRALETLYKPGSIFKIITAAAALESEVDMSRIFPVKCVGGVRYNPDEKIFWCWRKHGKISSLKAALDTSCNLAMAEIGFALGSDRLYEYSNKFGFGVPITLAFASKTMELSFPIATSTAPLISSTHFKIAERCCGLGNDIAITPLHAALLAATIANQGSMMTPILIKEIKNINGKVIGQGTSKIMRTPISKQTAEKIKAFMIDTVKNGIGKKAKVKGITVAGKTGTTGSSKTGLNGWFICFAPAENPEVAVAIYAEKEGSGMDVAAPIASNFLKAVLKK